MLCPLARHHPSSPCVPCSQTKTALPPAAPSLVLVTLLLHDAHSSHGSRYSIRGLDWRAVLMTALNRQDGAAAAPGPPHIRPAIRGTRRPQSVDERAATISSRPTYRCCSALSELQAHPVQQERAITAASSGGGLGSHHRIQGCVILLSMPVAYRCCNRLPQRCPQQHAVQQGLL